MKPKSKIILEYDPDYAQCRAAELIGIARARWLFADPPEAHQRVELVGEGDGDGGCVSFLFLGHGIGWAFGLVMQLDGTSDFGFCAGLFGIIAAHQALQLGKLADHTGNKIGFAELCCAPGVGGIGIDCTRNLMGQLGDALHAILLGAELFVEGDTRELGGHFVERLFQVLVPEELGI